MNRKSQNAGYSLKKQPPGTYVVLALSPLGFDYGGKLEGNVLDHVGSTLTIQWAGSEHHEVWRGDDCQYKVDRGLMVFKKPPKPKRTRIPQDKLICKQCGELRKDCDCPRIGATKPEDWGKDRNHPDRPVGSIDPALTGEGDDAIIASSQGGDPLPEEKEQDMPTDEKLSAKEVARELGTDARTLRKFFRSGNSPVDPVGQGGRYEIDSKAVKKVKKAFDNWGGGTKAKKDPDVPDDFVPDIVKSKAKKSKSEAENEAKALLDDVLDPIDDPDVEILDLDDLEGPTPEDLEDEDLDLEDED